MTPELPAFLQRLVTEHRVFLEGFDVLFRRAREGADPADRMETLKALASFCRVFYEDFHHGKEESLLFPVLAAHPGVNAGGPECVLHFDQQISSPPLEKARRVFATLGIEYVEPAWPPALQLLREAGSPLVIPVGDHEAGRLYLRAVDSCLRGSDEAAGEKILRLFDAYRDLQVRNIRKENGCLFHMSRQLVDPSQWSDLERREPAWKGGLHPLAMALIPT